MESPSTTTRRTRGHCLHKRMFHGSVPLAIGLALGFLAGCGGEVPAAPRRATSDGGADDAPSAAQGTGDGSSGEAGAIVFPGCRRAASLDDAGPDVLACAVGRALLQCVDDGGTICTCPSDDPAGCPPSDGEFTCGPAGGFTCQNLCGPAEYGVQCGGPPLLSPNSIVFQAPPAACRPRGAVHEEGEFECCPCE